MQKRDTVNNVPMLPTLNETRAFQPINKNAFVLKSFNGFAMIFYNWQQKKSSVFDLRVQLCQSLLKTSWHKVLSAETGSIRKCANITHKFI